MGRFDSVDWYLIVVVVCLLVSVVAACFLVYTLVNLDKLGIAVSHPRIIIEGVLVVVPLLLIVVATIVRVL